MVCLILKDNLFYGQDFQPTLLGASKIQKGGVIFSYWVSDPEKYGVVELDKSNKVISIEEKPTTPKSNYATPGLYFYYNNVAQIASNLKPSPRGELEIADVNKVYLERGNLIVRPLR